LASCCFTRARSGAHCSGHCFCGGRKHIGSGVPRLLPSHLGQHRRVCPPVLPGTARGHLPVARAASHRTPEAATSRNRPNRGFRHRENSCPNSPRSGICPKPIGLRLLPPEHPPQPLPHPAAINLFRASRTGCRRAPLSAVQRLKGRIVKITSDSV